MTAESGGELANSLAAIVADRYAAALDTCKGEINDEMHRNLRGLKGINREVARLRRGEHVAQRMKIQRERLELDRQKADADIQHKAEASALNQRRYEDSKRDEEVKALGACIDETQEYPEVRELFKQAFLALKKAKAAGKGRP